MRNVLPQDHDLFPEVPAFLPAVVPGETLFSWSARYHRLSGNALATRSSHQLFGDNRAGLRHDFPSHLDQFVQITGGLVGDSPSIATSRTMLGFFAPFLDEDRYLAALRLMQGTSVARLKMTLGLMPSRLGAAHPLKACTECMARDPRLHGITTWKMEHQWPSVWVCNVHGRQLQATRNVRELKFLHRYVLPEDLRKDDWLRPDTLTRDAKERLRRLASFSAALISDIRAPFRPSTIRFAALREASERHWIASDGSLRFHEVKEAFRKYYRGLQDIPGLGSQTNSEGEHGGALGMMLRKYPCSRHPAKLIALIAFFFESPAAFLEKYQEAGAMVESGNVSKYGAPINVEWRKELRRLIEVEGVSMTQAAKILSVSLPQAIRWAERDGITYKKRPRVLTPALADVLRLWFLKGLPAEQIADKAGVKAGFVRAYATNDPTMAAAWRTARFENDRDRRRNALIALLAAMRGVPISQIRRIPGNDYAWLSRNDREWLLENLPALFSIRPTADPFK